MINQLDGILNADFMMKHADARYYRPDLAPTYDEWTDMMSSGQLISKAWLMQIMDIHIERLNDPKKVTRILIVGGWYGQLAYFLTKRFQNTFVTTIDVDPKCKEYIDIAYYRDNARLSARTVDMMDYEHYHKFDIVINTSMEHITNSEEWLKKLKPNTIVVLQSNNNSSIPDHINCPKSLDDFKHNHLKTLSSFEYWNDKKFPMYTRYMVIGKV